MVPARSTWSTLIIRAWLDESGGLRARLTQVDEVDDPEAVINVVRDWLSSLHVPGDI
jgi:hypothetical protein